MGCTHFEPADLQIVATNFQPSQKCGYDYKLKFKPPTPNQPKKNHRKRKITWFNPPYSKHVKTNIGKKFLELIDKHFPAGHPLSKIVNRNCVKISYRCMPNMKAVISRHNWKVKKQEEDQIQPGCNCSGRLGPCPLDDKCQVKNVVYKAKVVNSDNTTNTYTGLTSTTFKKRQSENIQHKLERDRKSTRF